MRKVILSIFLFNLIFFTDIAAIQNIPGTKLDDEENQPIQAKGKKVDTPRILIVYYSRTGNTKAVAEKLAHEIDCDIDGIIDFTNRSGILGYTKSAYHAVAEKLTKIQEPEFDPADYEIIVIGTPVWAGNMSTPVRSYIFQYREQFERVAFFCTMGSSGDKQTFRKMEELCGKEPIETLSIDKKDMASAKLEDMIREFATDIIGK